MDGGYIYAPGNNGLTGRSFLLRTAVNLSKVFDLVRFSVGLVGEHIPPPSYYYSYDIEIVILFSRHIRSLVVVLFRR